MWAVLVAAGSGSRMKAIRPKQYLELAGKSVIERSLRALEASEPVSGILVVISVEDSYWQSLDLKCSKPMRIAHGGNERADSVLAGLTALTSEVGEDDWVLIHDAARPCLTPEHVQRLEGGLMGHECGGLLAVPLRDTVKQVEGDEVSGTLDRAQLWKAQTPQIYRYRLLVDALQSARSRNINVTDESMAMELAGYRPRVVEGSEDNLKITVPEDIALAEFLVRKCESAEGTG